MENHPTEAAILPATLQPLPYHRDVVSYLKEHEADLWQWFSSSKVRKEHADAARLELLKSNYRLEAQTQPRMYELAREVLGALHLEVPITLYQASHPSGLNAALVYLPGEAHIILVGAIADALSEPELKALLAHELAHFSFYDGDNNEFLVAAEILAALNNDSAARSCHRETDRLYRLYAEIYADRGAVLVTRDPLVAIAKLIKAETGLTEVSPEGYLRQAEEILSKGPVKASKETHPETFIRAKAIQLYARNGAAADAEIQKLIEGSPKLQDLDLLSQKRVAAVTRELVGHFLAPRWFHSEPILAHARAFFPDFAPSTVAALKAATVEVIKQADPSLQDYYLYVLLDFVAADRQLEETPLAAALQLGEQLGLRQRLAEMALEELSLTKKKLAAIDRDAQKILEKANKAGTES
jgi:hypothetical protein